MSQMRERINRNLNKLPALYSTDGTKGDLPAVYLFTPWAGATWVLWEYDPEDEIAFGMADLGYPEMGSVYIPELLAARGPLGIEIETDTSLNTRFAGYRNAGVPIPDYLEA